MKIVFTLCSNNYLAQAKTLGDSLNKSSPDYQFYIGLVDVLDPSIDYATEIGFPVILSNEIGIPGYDELWKKYSIIEFNTCVKPFYFQYFIQKFKRINYLFYFDPDIFIYNDLHFIENEFGINTKLLLTPHILTPIPLDDKIPGENIFLNHGTFNLGFLGLKNPELLNQFLDWWKDRTYNLGFDQTSNGLFVDQLWFNLVPIFFKDVKISKNPGLNVAPWNLHERKFSSDNAISFLGQTFPLIFYHFSNYNFNEPDKISKFYNRYVFEDCLYLNQIYSTYHKFLMNNGIEKTSKISWFYMLLKKDYFNEEKRGKGIENLNTNTSTPFKKYKYYLKKMVRGLTIRIYATIRKKA